MGLGEILKHLRTKQNLTQAELGKALLLKESTISCYESNKREPGLDTIRKIAGFFNVTTDYLLEHNELKYSKMDLAELIKNPNVTYEGKLLDKNLKRVIKQFLKRNTVDKIHFEELLENKEFLIEIILEALEKHEDLKSNIQ